MNFKQKLEKIGDRPDLILIITDEQRATQHFPPKWEEQNLQTLTFLKENGFSFDRTYYNELSPGPAERVKFSPLSTVQVPPGIDSLYYRSVTSVPYKLDTSEYPPRF